jgi:hypothetical protein
MILYRAPLSSLNKQQEHIPLNRNKFNESRVLAKTGFDPHEMLDIFENDCQIKVIERCINHNITQYLDTAASKLVTGYKCLITVGERISENQLALSFLPNQKGRDAFLKDLDCLSELYFDLLGCPQIGLRLEVLNSAMCPKFHVDKTSIRMVCTYQGKGTQWLDDQYADRSKLGMASAKIDDSESGLILNPQGVHEVPQFAIALLKGSLWQGNHLRGIIHRSPPVLNNKPRVLVAIDAVW